MTLHNKARPEDTSPAHITLHNKARPEDTSPALHNKARPEDTETSSASNSKQEQEVPEQVIAACLTDELVVYSAGVVKDSKFEPRGHPVMENPL